MNIVLVPIGSLKPSTYNPRETDPERLDVVTLSLRKLGWLLPIYATDDGEIISGHQRHLAAQVMGQKMVPLCNVGAWELPKRKAANILFNRATNDVQRYETTADMAAALSASGVIAAANGLPDKPEHYPCMNARAVATSDLIAANKGRWQNYPANVAGALEKHGVVMPVICGPNLQIINGIGGVQKAAERGRKTCAVVELTAEEAAVAAPLLNWLSMDFAIHTRYADLLRYNSFRRARRVRKCLGFGFIFAVNAGKPDHAFDINNPAHRGKWKKKYGTSILDFGAGHLTETELLRSVGVRCTPFEPYRLTPGTAADIDKAESLHLTSEFLAEVAAGVRWSSIFIASVLNSVPFEQDRQHIVTICAALCEPQTKVYACASGTQQESWQNTGIGKDWAGPLSGSLKFQLDYEPHVLLGEISDKPKVQKYHSPREFYDLFDTGFERVSVRNISHNVTAIASQARPLDTDALAAALEFEFDLPYPDGTRMDMVAQAKEAFAARAAKLGSR